MWSVVVLLMAATIALATRLFTQPGAGHSGFELIGQALSSREFWLAAAVGLLAQTVDGALGMAYGITSTSFLLATGTQPGGGQRFGAHRRGVHHRACRASRTSSWAM